MHDALGALRDAGCPVDQLSQAQRDVLADLTEQETVALVAVQRRLLAAEGEVLAHDLKLL
ncbi:aroma-sacti cluster domain-containing protein [Actinoplanes sp. NPDC051494]|uniref:aroma-sacti cluster domain-containing protein n=1 Tax=Actinoplanes sp. NPDC051494 TaxID=3363907 RepID=UPI0037989B01